jgi:hypothetical protein
MCIVIDNCVKARVFDSANAEHHLFKPVYEWIISGDGKLVYGGTTYRDEALAGAFGKLVLELKKTGKAINVGDAAVDAVEGQVRAAINDPDFDDPHIVAILKVSKCRLVCTSDKRGNKYFTHRKFFPSRARRPQLYLGLADARKLCSRNIADCCRPCIRLGKADRLNLLDRLTRAREARLTKR